MVLTKPPCAHRSQPRDQFLDRKSIAQKIDDRSSCIWSCMRERRAETTSWNSHTVYSSSREASKQAGNSSIDDEDDAREYHVFIAGCAAAAVVAAAISDRARIGERRSSVGQFPYNHRLKPVLLLPFWRKANRDFMTNTYANETLFHAATVGKIMGFRGCLKGQMDRSVLLRICSSG